MSETKGRVDQQTYTVRDLTIGPYTSAWEGGPDLSCLPESIRIRVRGKAQDRFDPSLELTPETRSGYFYFGGPLKVHFGHLLTDTIPRLWAYKSGKFDGVVFSPLGVRGEPPEWVMRLFEYAGIPSKDVVLAQEPSKYELVSLAAPGSELGLGPTDWYLDYIKGYLPVPRSMNQPKRLFLGRSHILNKGTIMGETYFESLIIANGFSYFRPEEHSIESQISALRGADQVVFTEGSSVYAIELLGSISGEFFMLPRRNGTDYLFSPHIVGRGSGFTRIDSGPLIRLANLRGKIGPSSPTYYLNPEKAQQHLYSLGLIKDPNFNRYLYKISERSDSNKYFGRLEELSESNLNLIKSKRGW